MCKPLRLILAALLISCAFSNLTFFQVTAQEVREDSTIGRTAERVILKKSDFKPPVTITAVKTNKKKIELGKPFVDDDNWLRGLTVTVANASGRSVVHVGVEVLIKRPGRPGKEPGALWHLEYGNNPFRYENQESLPPVRVKPLLPGDFVEIGLTDHDYEQLGIFLNHLAFSSGSNQIEIRVTTIGFSDGTAWFGRMLRRDLNHPSGWAPMTNLRLYNRYDQQFYEPQTRLGASRDVDRAHLNAFRRPPALFNLAIKWTKLMEVECGFAYPSFVNCEPQPAECQYQLVELYGSLNPPDALEPQSEPCQATIGGFTLTCTTSLSARAVPCPNPPCGQEFDTCVQSSDCCTGFKCGGGQCINDQECFPPCSGEYVCFNGICGYTPVIIDVRGNGINLTNAANGVQFDGNADGVMGRLAWTAAESDDSWLVLDRNRNGVIDDGSELFGSSTPQPSPPSGQFNNGFLALAVFDHPENGGNSDGRISSGDTIFSRLQLWQDKNHNGVSEQGELRLLQSFNIDGIDLSYQEFRRIDQNGNEFKYRARIYDGSRASVRRWAWDVLLLQAD